MARSSKANRSEGEIFVSVKINYTSYCNSYSNCNSGRLRPKRNFRDVARAFETITRIRACLKHSLAQKLIGQV